MPETTRQLAAIMFTDIVGYTALMGEDSNKALDLIRKSKGIQKPLVEQHNGIWLKEMGDGAMAQFSTALDAVNCAIEIQKAARKEFNGKLRIGIHLGDITIDNNDIYGDGVNVASRLESIADPGGIYISDAIEKAIRGQGNIEAKYLGEVKLKNVNYAVNTYAIQRDGLPVPSVKLAIKLTSQAKINSLYIIIALFVISIGGYFFYQTEGMTDVSDDKSIAVLAFSDMSPNQDQEYFSDGISEELLNLLAKIPELRVISRTSSFSYKDKNMTMEKIGEELKVSHILEGSVRKSGDNLRITTQLIQVTGSHQLWSKTYNLEMKDILKIQDEIAEAVIGQLKITLLGDIPKTQKLDPKAYNLYLEAVYSMQPWTMEATLRAEAILNQSIAIDSTYAPAWSELGNITLALTNSFYTKPYREGLAAAKAATEKSIELDRTNTGSHAILSQINNLEWDFDAAQTNINKALRLNSESFMVLVRAASHAKYAGKFDEGIEFLQQAFKLEPQAHWIDMVLGIMYYYSGDLDEASNAMQRIIYLRPEGEEQQIFMSLILLEQGKNMEALAAAEKEPVDYWKLYAKAHAVYALGRQDASDSLLGLFIDNHSKKHPALVASIYAHRKENDYAFELLEIAFEQRAGYLVEAINFPFFKNLYNDPRWDIFIAKMNLPKDHWLLLK